MPQPMDELQAAALRNLVAALGTLGLQATVIGGVAVSLVAKPRFTADIDAMIVFDTALVDGLVAALEAHGFRPRFSGMAAVAQQARLVAVVHTGTELKVDLALGCMPFEEEVVARATTHQVGDVTLRLPTPEDLIILKAIANRPKDREDIRTIAAVHPGIDRDRIRHWVQEYAALLEEPGLWAEIEPLLR